MKLITNKKLEKTFTKFSELPVGEFFDYQGTLCLKVAAPQGSNVNTIRLYDCYLVYITPETVVFPITAEIHHEPINNE